jgi:phosphatidylserine decarboxylase
MSGIVVLVSWRYDLYYLLGIFSLFILFTLYFLRDPWRKWSIGENLIVSSADGKVLFAGDATEDNFMGGECKKVVIFMNVFNVHRNRSPIEGVVKFYRYNKGKFKPAMSIDNLNVNEHNLIGIEGKDVKCLVSQIAGLIAQRVVFYKEAGAFLRQTQELGIIRYGSANVIYFPSDFEISVKAGDKVKAGVSIIGRRTN